MFDMSILHDIFSPAKKSYVVFRIHDIVVMWSDYCAAVGGEVPVSVGDPRTGDIDGYASVQNGSRTDIRPTALLLPRNH